MPWYCFALTKTGSSIASDGKGTPACWIPISWTWTWQKMIQLSSQLYIGIFHRWIPNVKCYENLIPLVVLDKVVGDKAVHRTVQRCSYSMGLDMDKLFEPATNEKSTQIYYQKNRSNNQSPDCKYKLSRHRNRLQIFPNWYLNDLQSLSDASSLRLSNKNECPTKNT